MTVTAADVNRALKAKYSGDEWRIWFEVSQTTGAWSGRRADAVAMNIWPSKDFQLHVFEVKISRSDFKSEMADLTKWKAVGQYADFFWLACPRGLVDHCEVPEEWGLMELGKGGLRIRKQAPLRADPKPLDRGFAASLLRSGESLTQLDIDRRISEGIEAGRSEIEARVSQSANRELALLKAEQESWAKWVEGFEAQFGLKPNRHSLPQNMAERIKLAARLEPRNLKPFGQQAAALAQAIDDVLKEAIQ